jgi:aldose 1-epimerase
LGPDQRRLWRQIGLLSSGNGNYCQRMRRSAMIQHSFGKTSDGSEATLYTLKNKNGLEAAITNYGATLVSVKAPDRSGNFADLTAGYDDVLGYESGRSYFGGTVGRYANRIGNAEFTLNGVKYTLAKNNGPNHLHGGFNKKWWAAEEVSKTQTLALRLSLLSADGDEGYPGNLTIHVTYALNDANELSISFEAATDEDTVLNLTNHSYFNLAGAGSILDHEVALLANHFLPVNPVQIPTGEIRSVQNTPFDFRRQRRVGDRIDSSDEQIKIGLGYDHTYLLDNTGGGSQPTLAARAVENKSGRTMEVLTTQPGLQFYTGNHLDGSEHGKGKTYTSRTFMCFEAQHFPDSPNQPGFPSTVLRKGDTFYQHTIYRFSAE